MHRMIIGLLLFGLDAGESRAQLRSFLSAPLFQVLETGTRTDNIRDRQVVVVQNQADFESLWDRTFVSSGPIPEIDWTYQQVVGIYAGEKPSMGYGFRLVDVQDAGVAFVIHVGESGPPEGRMVSSLESTPFMLILMAGKKPVQVVWH